MISIITSLIIAAPTPRWQAHAELRVAAGLSPAGLSLALLAGGARLGLTPSLSLDMMALGVVPLDASDANAGGGGELGLRVSPFTGPVRPFFRASMGLTFFARRAPFLPGGDVYEGVLSWALGLELTLGPATLVLDASVLHLSNGQGLGPHNPAYDGLGGTLGVSLPLGAGAVPPPWYAQAPTLDGVRDEPTPRVEADLGAGQADALLAVARLRLAQRLGNTLLVQADVEAGSLAAEPLVEVGVDVVMRAPTVALGVHAGYRGYAGIDALVTALQLEVHAAQEASFIALAHVEHSDFAGTSGRAALGVRVFPARTLAIDLGIGFQAFDHAPADLSDPYLGFEWAPLVIGPCTFALFLERQIAGVDVAGLRMSFDTPRGPRDVARHAGWRRIR